MNNAANTTTTLTLKFETLAAAGTFRRACEAYDVSTTGTRETVAAIGTSERIHMACLDMLELGIKAKRV